MSTAATTHFRFSDPLAMAAAVVVILGGATAIGVVAQVNDGSTSPAATPGTSVQAPHACYRNACTPTWNHGHSHPGGHQTNGGDYVAPPRGGHVMPGLP